MQDKTLPLSPVASCSSPKLGGGEGLRDSPASWGPWPSTFLSGGVKTSYVTITLRVCFATHKCFQVRHLRAWAGIVIPISHRREQAQENKYLSKVTPPEIARDREPKQ